MKEYFLKLYQYNRWANKRVLDCAIKQAVRDEKILSVMGHILAAQFIWLHRIRGLPLPAFKLWSAYSLADLDQMANDAGEQWLDFITSTENFNWELTYHNYVGDSYVNNVEMIMIHLVNHSTYHRGQVAMLLRQKSFEPVNTDFITYDRVINGQWKD